MEILKAMFSVDTVLSAVGGAALVWSAYAIGQVAIAMLESSDLNTAMTPSLPRTAFEGNVVWITGASSGIGKEIAMYLAARGAKLILSARNKEALEKVAEECRLLHPKTEAKVLVLDLSEKATLTSKAEEALKTYGQPVDVLVNNGGVSTRAMAHETTIEMDEFLMQVDFLSHVAITKLIVPHMKDNPNARIINTGSIASIIGVPVHTAYCAAKHALVGFMEALRIEFFLRGETNIHILNVVLGSTNTDLRRRAVVNASSPPSSSTSNVVKTFGEGDPNIAKGLDSKFVAERILSVSYHKSVDQCWLAKGKEMAILFLNQYLPQTAYTLLSRAAAKQYAVQKMTVKEQDPAKGDVDKKVN